MLFELVFNQWLQRRESPYHWWLNGLRRLKEPLARLARGQPIKFIRDSSRVEWGLQKRKRVKMRCKYRLFVGCGLRGLRGTPKIRGGEDQTDIKRRKDHESVERVWQVSRTISQVTMDVSGPCNWQEHSSVEIAVLLMNTQWEVMKGEYVHARMICEGCCLVGIPHILQFLWNRKSNMLDDAVQAQRCGTWA